MKWAVFALVLLSISYRYCRRPSKSSSKCDFALESFNFEPVRSILKFLVKHWSYPLKVDIHVKRISLRIHMGLHSPVLNAGVRDYKKSQCIRRYKI